MTPQEMRNQRLKNDHSEMINLRGELISWRILRGAAPFVEEYELTVHVRTIIGDQPSYRDSHQIRLSLPNGYPVAPPEIVMLSRPAPFHPNWWESGKWCYGTWTGESLGRHVIRMIRTLQYDPEITNENSPANRTANNWYQGSRSLGIFPCDNKTLPDPTHKKGTFQIKSVGNKTFNIHRT
jgi:ubiquitin-protein ligase